ncbi:hypothetical protein DYB26_013509 [Aphanomyces astaci]|uniref:HTH CENPB-type domain-containing protein n=1 Tax=Aphanomyces astaci TaxID=112090 RepID=A0A3R6YM68_APHAT|nr:hypothetical protein DYB26_013509 [Aphanomyces astaci]
MMKTTWTVERQKRGPKQLLPPGIEEDIVEWIAAMQRRGWPVDRAAVIHKACQVLSLHAGIPRSVSRGWYQKFCTRNPRISERLAQRLSKSRNKVDKEGIITYFNSLLKACLGFHCTARDIYNVDETSFKTKTHSKRVVAIRGSRSVWIEENAEAYHLTIVMTATADGTLVPPAFILPGVTCETSVLDECPVDGALVTTAPKAFMNSTIFNTWLIAFGEWKLEARGGHPANGFRTCGTWPLSLPMMLKRLALQTSNGVDKDIGAATWIRTQVAAREDVLTVPARHTGKERKRVSTDDEWFSMAGLHAAASIPNKRKKASIANRRKKIV